MIQRTFLRSSRALSATLRPQPAFRALNPSSSLSSRSAVAPVRIAARWYSEAPEAAKKDEAASKKSEGEAPADAAAESAKKELEAKNKEIVELKDKYLRSVADFRNLQERTKREVSAAKDFALSRFSRDLIESVDNLDRALTTVPAELLIQKEGGNADLQNLHSGLKMTETILMGTLKKHGLERFDPSVEREKFDPNKHEAVFQTPQPDKEDGTVFHTQQKGFLLNGRVIRAAKVGVVKNS